MLTGIRLGNFKAFGETQHIPIKPLTLIFGANSAGKSSIIHGLLLACHANETGNLDVNQTRIGGESVSLGGFRQYVHRRDKIKNVEIGLQFHSTKFWETTFGQDIGLNDQLCDVRIHIAYYEKGSLPRLDGSRPFVHSASLQVNGELLITFERAIDGKMRITTCNRQNKYFVEHCAKTMHSYEEGHWADEISATDFQQLLNTVNSTLEHCDIACADIQYSGCLFPTKLLRDMEGIYFAEISSADFLLDNYCPDSKELMQKVIDQTLMEILEALGGIIPDVLNSVAYLGPIRSYPPRHVAFPDDRDPNWYAGGGYAWEAVRTNAKVREAVNNWLGSDERLQTPYQLEVNRYVAENRHQDAIEELVLRDKRFDTVVSHRDVGFGISQVLPVLVSAYGSEQKIVAIEQPEIHLHPKLQAELGDVFIESALGERKNTFLLETHSEHLILRIMRRMRDTAWGTLPEGLPPVRPEDVAILYVQPKADNSTSVVSVLELDEEGQLLDPWPGGFFEEGFNERFA